MQNIIVLGGLLVLAFPLGAAECQLLLELVDAAGRPIPSEEGAFRIDLVGESDKIVVNDSCTGRLT